MDGRSRRSVMFLAVAILSGAVALPWAGSAFADPTACSPNDITTGGGWIPPGGRSKRTFALEAGFGPNAPVPGRLVFVNHASGERLHGIVTLYVPNPTNSRHMEGVGTINQDNVTFQLDVTDVAEPGRPDLFKLTYQTEDGVGAANGSLGGGNIQIRPLCGAT
jgi:hypothetical protein